MPFLNVAFYRFVDLPGASEAWAAWPDLPTFRRVLQALPELKSIRGKIILSPEGINGSLCGEPTLVNAVLDYLRSIPEFSGLEVKESWSENLAFRRMLVKLKTEVIPLGDPTIRPLEKTGRRLSVDTLKEWLDQGKEVVLLDTRNDYEIEQGTFKGAMQIGLKHFRDFPEKLAEAAPKLRKTPVVMFCTGGIRCEKATPVAERLGLENVFQLEGGILKYFERYGASHYVGGCFVFDDRQVLDPELRPQALSPAIAMGTDLPIDPL